MTDVDYKAKLQDLGCKLYKPGKGFAFSVRGKQYTCDNADIWINPKTNTYYIHGEMRDASPNVFMNQLLSQVRNQQQFHQHDENCNHDHGIVSEEDVKTVMEQGGVDEAKAKELLEKHHEVVQAVVEAKQSQNE